MPRKITKKIIGDIYDLRTPLEIKTEGSTYVYNKNSSLSKWLTFTEDISSSGTATEIIDGLSFTALGTKQPDFVTNDLPTKISELSTVSLNSAYGFQAASSNTTLTLQEPAYESRFDFGTVTSPANNAFTFAAWVNFSTISDQVIASKWHNSDPALQQYELSLNGGSRSLKFRIFHPGGSGLGAGVYSIQTDAGIIGATDEWFHIVMTFEGDASKPNAFKFYLNGELKSTITPQLQLGGIVWTLSYLPNTIAPFSIGNDHQHGGNEFIGKIADFAAWTTALSSEDIYTLYNYISTEQNETIFRSGYVNLPPRIEIRNRDNATGSYPTTLRMGDKDRRGSYSTQFDDTNTIFFGRRIRDNFELKDEDKVDGVLGVSKNINSKLWEWSKGLEIRRELFRTAGADSTSRDGALVFVGPPRGASGRFLRTKNKIKNATLQAEVIFGPYNESRTALGYGLGLKSPGGLEDRGLKIQVSTTGAVGTWITIKTLTGNADSLFLLSTANSREEFETLLKKRKRVKIKLSPADFASVGSSEFYLRFAQTSVINSNRAEWAIGYVNIEYHNEDVRYPIMVDSTSRVGQRVTSGAVATPHTLPTITAPGRSISGISDVHLKFTPGEGISAFDESRINIKPEDFFFQQGSDPDVISRMSAPLWSKTQFVIDLSPNEETEFGLNTPSPTEQYSYNETDDTIKQQLMVYWNSRLRRWEKISQGVSGNAMGNSLENMIASGALGFSAIDLISTGSDSTYENQSILPTDVLSAYVRPTTVFGFPFEGKYHASSSQYVLAEDLGITKPFILEKCQITFDAKFEFADNNDNADEAYALLYAYPNTGSAKPSDRANATHQNVWIPTFFMLRQQDFDTFVEQVEYQTDVGGSLYANKRKVEIPTDFALLSSSSTDFTEVDSSRELITYGQITLYSSGSDVTSYLDINEALEKGLARDEVVDVTAINGQDNAISNLGFVDSLTGSFNINFPSRLSAQIKGASRLNVKDSNDDVAGLWLDKQFGGRAYSNLDSSARAMVGGTPGLSKSGVSTTYATATQQNPLTFDTNSPESNDIYSPYLIMPKDKIVFGWQYPVTERIRRKAPGNADNRFHSMTLFGNSKLTLFGSQLQDKREFHETINQNLGSSAIHEAIGSEPVVDEFVVSRAIENNGNYLDNFVTSTSTNPVKRVGTLVQSRLTTEKGDSNKGKATIKFPTRLYGPFSNNPGINDGDRIVIKDAQGTVVHFYGYRGSKFGPANRAGSLPSHYDNNGTDSDAGTPGAQTITNAAFMNTLWAGITHVRLATVTNPYFGYAWGKSSIGTAVEYPRGAIHLSNSNLQVNGETADQIFAFKIEGGNSSGSAMSNAEQEETLRNLLDAINTSPLRVNGSIYNPLFSKGPQLDLVLTDGGSAGQFEVVYTDANDLTGPAPTVNMQIAYDPPTVSGFAGGNDLLDSALGSFTRVIPTGDGARIYSDSLIRRADIGFSNSSYGTMQALGRGIRPKYYLDGKKYGQSIHFLEQAKDSKTKFSLKTKKFGLLDTVKVGALQSPVSITFVSGTNSSSTGFRTFSKKSPTDAVNKTVNSVLTGAFYDPA